MLIYIAGSAINPARDLGPRLLTAMVGYGRHGTCHLGRAPGELFDWGSISVFISQPVLALVPNRAFVPRISLILILNIIL